MPVTLLFAAIVIGSIYFLYGSASSELAPQEDQGVVILFPTSAPDATLQQKQLFDDQVQGIMAEGAGGGSELPGRKPGPVDRRHHPEAVGQTAHATRRRSSSQLQGQLNAVAGQQDRRVPAAARCPARRACRSSSC